jgi:hypothetical protein
MLLIVIQYQGLMQLMASFSMRDTVMLGDPMGDIRCSLVVS